MRSDPNHSPHPWWSRVLYFVYGAVLAAGAVYAATEDSWQVAAVMAGIAAILFWKAAQRVR